MNKPKVGDSLYLVDVGNRARRGLGKQRPCVVSKIGRKYFYVTCQESPSYEVIIPFDLIDWREKSDYSAQYALFESKEDYEELAVKNAWMNKLSSTFQYSSGAKFTLAQLTEVGALLGLTLK